MTEMMTARNFIAERRLKSEKRQFFLSKEPTHLIMIHLISANPFLFQQHDINS